jgi:hypothetical protein
MSETDTARDRRSATKRRAAGTVAFIPGGPGEASSGAGESRSSVPRCVWAGAARWWFESLDGQPFDGDSGPWVVQVMGIHEVRPHLWIQLESSEPVPRRIVLHVTLETPLDAALAAIAASRPVATGSQVIDVSRLARPIR